jgi:hypothetical protein
MGRMDNVRTALPPKMGDVVSRPCRTGETKSPTKHDAVVSTRMVGLRLGYGQNRKSLTPAQMTKMY